MKKLFLWSVDWVSYIVIIALFIPIGALIGSVLGAIKIPRQVIEWIWDEEKINSISL